MMPSWLGAERSFPDLFQAERRETEGKIVMRSYCSHRVIAVSKTYKQFEIIRSIYEPTLLYGSASRFQPVEQFLQIDSRRNMKAARGQVSEKTPLFF